jgi:GGDEF domain-containing protein
MKLEDVLSIATGETVAARVIQSLNEPFTIKGRPVTTSASVGISISDSDGVKHPEELLKEATTRCMARRDQARVDIRPAAVPR